VAGEHVAMKVSELMDALTLFDPFDDIVVVGEDTEAYFTFTVRERKGRGVTKGQHRVVALAITGELSQYFLTVE
jgi:hypothetical protein